MLSSYDHSSGCKRDGKGVGASRFVDFYNVKVHSFTIYQGKQEKCIRIKEQKPYKADSTTEVKRQPTGENFCKSYIWKTLLFRMHKEYMLYLEYIIMKRPNFFFFNG